MRSSEAREGHLEEEWSYVGMVTLDIKNAFNTASWEKILDAMMTKDLRNIFVD